MQGSMFADGLAVLLLSGVVTAGLLPWLIGQLQRFEVVDHANGRSSHRGTVPRGGGLAIMVGTMLSLAVTSSAWIDDHRLDLSALFAMAVAFALLGLIDDVRTLPALLRLGAQLVFTILFLIIVSFDPSGGLGVIGNVLAAWWIIGFVNAFNFMDGINGISSATTVLLGSSLALASWRWDGGIEMPALALVGGALGFAPFNASSGRVFLGDAGSYLLGGALGLMTVIAVGNGVPSLPLVLPSMLYVGDVAFTMACRAHRRERIFKSHRSHVYQRLTHVAGWSHGRTTIVVGAFTVVLVVLGQVAGGTSPIVQVAAAVAGTCLVGLYLSLPHLASKDQPVEAEVAESFAD